ncbi:exosortase U [Planctomycetes bacterium TBK1r]|uniref:Transmembrane exosortase (Exosortase_EpsH) n=2 Tax=Stieleria TaxID=2795973 RepID=A0ABX5XN68_9BACT|nr:Transmembrane exosortase (Exosortase_EpsH) [Planctomycetes bacterium TBK1r]
MSTTDSTGLYTSMLDQAEPIQPATTSDSQPHPNWRWFWLGLFLAVAPLLVPYFIGMWGNPTYRYFPFAIAAVAWLTYLRFDGYFYPPRGWFSWAAIGFALLLTAFGTVVQFPWFAAVAFAILCATMLYAMRGPEDSTLLVLVLPLLTIVQLVRADTLLVLWLQNVTTWMSSVLLDTLAVPHAVTNNVIQLADRELFVAEACSGIQSVFTLSFLAFLMISWRRRRIWMAPIYLAIACLLAIFANVIRVTVVALVANSFQFDLAEGWPHQLLGYVALAIAFGFLLSFDYLIATLLHRVPEESEFNPLVAGWNYLSLNSADEATGGRGTQRNVMDLLARDKRSGAFRWAQGLVDNRIAQIGFAALAGLICLASLTQVIRSRKPANLVQSDKALVFDPPPDLINDSLNVLTVVGHKANRGYEDPRLGANSDIWECQWDDVTVQFVLSQPHQGWHELCNCYERLDWMLLDRDIQSPDQFESMEIVAKNPDALTSTYVLARFKRGPTQHGYLIFAGIGSDGTLVDAPDSLSAFTHRVWNRIDSTGVWEQNEVIMFQMWITSPDKLSPRKLQDLQEEFIAARGRIADAIIENAGRTLPAQALRIDAPAAVSAVAKSEQPMTAKELN